MTTTTSTTISITTSSAPAFHTRARMNNVQFTPSTYASPVNQNSPPGPFRFMSPSPSMRFTSENVQKSPINTNPDRHGSFVGREIADSPHQTNAVNQSVGHELISSMMQMFREERDIERRERLERERFDRIEREKEREQRELDRRLLEESLKNDKAKSSMKEMRIPPFDEKNEDIDMYLQNFEKIATLQKWDKDAWTVRLGTLLTGRAREIFVRMPNDSDYESLKEALLTCYKLSAETYRTKFRTTRKSDNETYAQYAFKLETFLNRWMSLAGKEATFDDLKDMIIYEQILNTANFELAIFLKERKPSSIACAVELAENYSDAHRHSRIRYDAANRDRRNGQNNGMHKGSKDTLEKDSIVNSDAKDDTKLSGSSGFKARNQNQNNYKPRHFDGCWKCGGGSHYARDCTYVEKKSEKASELAAVSLSEDIDLRYCYPVSIGGIDTCALRDTGAHTICVSKSWIPNNAEKIGQTTLMFAERNNKKVCPIVIIPIKTPFVSGNVRAVVLDNPVKPMIIGNQVTFEDGKTLSLETEPVQKNTDKPQVAEHDRSNHNIISIEIEGRNKSEVDNEYCKVTDKRYIDQTKDLSKSEEKSEQYHIESSYHDGQTIQLSMVQTRAQKVKEGKSEDPLSLSGTSIGNLKPTQISQMQKCDPSLDKYWDLTKQKEPYRGASYCEYDMLLFRVFKKKDGLTCRQLVVPTELRSSVLKMAHDTPMAGHMGSRRTLDRIWHSFYWPGICREVRKYCRSCDICQKATPQGQLRKVKLGRMPIIEQPFERVGVDIVGPLIPMSERGFRYLLVMQDHSTRYPDAKPLKHIDSVSVAEALFEMFTRVGIPREILSDNGSQFTSECMFEVLRLLGIKGIHTTPWHAQCNGLVENLNGTLKSMIRKLCVEKPKDWDRYIPAILFAYREVPQESLQYSPFELLYGRNIRGPLSVLKDVWSRNVQDNEVRTTVDYVANLRERIEETCKIAHANLSKAQDKQAKNFNIKTVDRSFKAGDMVLMLKPERKNKMQMSWQGPFRVEARVNESDYKLRIGDKSKIYHANLLKHYEVRTVVASAAMVIEESEIEVSDLECEEVGMRKEHGIHLMPLKQTETVHDIQFSESLSDNQLKELKDVVGLKSDVFTDIPSCCTVGECDITLESEKPIFVRQYPLPHSQEETVKEEVKAMLKLGVIEPASSPYSSPAVLVKKKDASVRFCIDFRRLNKHIRFDAEPMPDIDAIFAKLGKAKFFSKLDLTKGYWSIKMKEEDKCKTAFTTPLGQFQFRRMPFGLKTAGAIFSRTMRKVLLPLKLDCLHNFMDDMLIATETWEEHVTALKLLLQRLEQVNMSARPKKCYLGFQQISFLGHVVGDGKMRPEEDKVKKLQKAERPKSKKQLRAFLGLSGYYRKFIANYSTIALPLSERTKKDYPDKVEWDETCEQAFNILKDNLSQYPVVVLPDQRLPFILRTDASGEGLGAALMQNQGDGLQPIAYASKKLSPAEKNYATIEQECLAVVWGIRKFYPFLYGRQFIVETDHNPLKYLDRIRPMSRRLMGWAMELQSHSFTVQSIPGKENVVADALSRL